MTRNNQVNGNESNIKPVSTKETTMNIIKITIIAFMLAFGPAWISGWAEECRDSTGAPVECEEDDSDSGDTGQPDPDMDDPTKEDESEDNGPTIMVDPQVEAFVVAMVEALQREREATDDATVDEALGEAIEMLHRWNRSLQTCASTAAGDFNGDGTVDGSDFIIWNNTSTDANADAMLEQLLGGCDPSLPQPEVGTIVAAAIESDPDTSTTDTETEMLSLVLRMKFEVPSTGQTFEIDLLGFINNTGDAQPACYLRYKLGR